MLLSRLNPSSLSSRRSWRRLSALPACLLPTMCKHSPRTITPDPPSQTESAPSGTLRHNAWIIDGVVLWSKWTLAWIALALVAMSARPSVRR